MNATEVIKELEKHGGVADKEWHGEKLEMKTNEQRAEEALVEGVSEQGFEGQQEKGINNGTDNHQFEIEVEESKTNKRTSNVLDALQRQQPTSSAVF
jgi:hypothetical protein